MKDYTIWLNGGNSIGGTAEESDLISLKEYFKKVKRGESYSRCEFNDTDGIVCLNLSDVQAIAIMKCSQNKDIGFNIDSQISLDVVEQSAEKFTTELRKTLEEMER